MSKKRRIRKHRSQWDRIEWRRKECESRMRRGLSCRHYFFCDNPGRLDKIADIILAKDGPSMGELRLIACSRHWEVIRHPMTQLYKMIDPKWYEGEILRANYRLAAKKEMESKSDPVTRRSKIEAEKLLRKAVLRRRSRSAASKAHLKACFGDPYYRIMTWNRCSIRRCLLQAKRYRAIARKNKVASLSDKYVRPRVSRTGEPSR